jgi:hypothetical protein
LEWKKGPFLAKFTYYKIYSFEKKNIILYFCDKDKKIGSWSSLHTEVSSKERITMSAHVCVEARRKIYNFFNFSLQTQAKLKQIMIYLIKNRLYYAIFSKLWVFSIWKSSMHCWKLTWVSDAVIITAWLLTQWRIWSHDHNCAI